MTRGTGVVGGGGGGGEELSQNPRTAWIGGGRGSVLALVCKREGTILRFLPVDFKTLLNKQPGREREEGETRGAQRAFGSGGSLLASQISGWKPG